MMPNMRHAVLIAIALAGCAPRFGNGNPDASGGDGGGGGDDAGGGAGSDGAVPDGPGSGPVCGARPCASIAAIYVAPSGSDDAAGTKDAPLRTITAGIAKAFAHTPGDAVFVQAGSYAEAVEMRGGVAVYGGFDASWGRGAAPTEIVAASPAVAFNALTATTGLDGVTVKSADAAPPGRSSIAVLITGSTLVELVNVTVLPGNGAVGSDGTGGSNGGAGTAGGNGGKGVEHDGFPCDNHTLPVGGTAGGSACGRNGGVGGAPGVADGSGGTGGVGVGGTSAGAGGASHNGGLAGGNGANGGLGLAGLGGAEAGSFAGATYVPANGGDGTPGGHADGGGGGGGGGGGTTLCDSSGSSGGGGGGGGCGGNAGTAGTGGGGSFGIVVVDSQVTLKSSTVTAGTGGAGGQGGGAGMGGPGGAAGAGGEYGGSGEQDDGGNGAAGGRGGNGGAGGAGGGGGGGPSAAVVCVGTGIVSVPQSTLAGGTGGAGGASAGVAGAPGLSTRTIGCTFF